MIARALATRQLPPPSPSRSEARAAHGAPFDAPLGERCFFEVSPRGKVQQRLMLLTACSALEAADWQALKDRGRLVDELRVTHDLIMQRCRPPDADQFLEVPRVELLSLAHQAALVAGGRRALTLCDVPDPGLRLLCLQRCLVDREDLHAFADAPAPVGPRHNLSRLCRHYTHAFLLDFAFDAAIEPDAPLPRLYFAAFFRPLAVAFVAAGTPGLARAMEFLGCCQGADHAATVAFGQMPPQRLKFSLPMALMPCSPAAAAALTSA